MDVYQLAEQFYIPRLEQLCIQYLEFTILPCNVLEALHNADKMNLTVIKEFCLRFIVKECNFTQIVMSKEFDTLYQPLMVEIIRRKQMPQARNLPEMQYDISIGILYIWYFKLNYFYILINQQNCCYGEIIIYSS